MGVAKASTDEPGKDASVAAWLLSGRERGNDASILAGRRPWTTGNAVTPLLHGAAYFRRLTECLSPLESGARVLLADWRGDHDEALTPDGITVGGLFAELARRGVQVFGLLWRSHPSLLGFQEEAQAEFARLVNEAGGEVLLDERVRRAGSHHQKLVLLERDGSPAVAFVGGIDLCRGRRDDERHEGDPQEETLDAAYGRRPGWHDVQAEVRGPAATDLAITFRERWNDRTPVERRSSVLGRMRARVAREPTLPKPLPPAKEAPPSGGTCAVQVLRTYAAKHPPFPFAPAGERSIARGIRKALLRARSIVYVEDQYLWSEDVAAALAGALRRAPLLRLIAVVPRYPERDGRISGPVYRLGQSRMLERLREAGGKRVGVYDLENNGEHAIYVHAKTMVVDDVFALIGSDNLNRRSWTHDSELSIAVVDGRLDARSPSDPGGLGDGARVFARELRLALWREHLGDAGHEDAELLDPVAGFEAWRRAATRLDAWHAGGRRGPRPPGQVRRHESARVRAYQRLWAEPIYRTLVDPDGRPARLRLTGRF